MTNLRELAISALSESNLSNRSPRLALFLQALAACSPCPGGATGAGGGPAGPLSIPFFEATNTDPATDTTGGTVALTLPLVVPPGNHQYMVTADVTGTGNTAELHHVSGTIQTMADGHPISSPAWAVADTVSGTGSASTTSVVSLSGGAHDITIVISTTDVADAVAWTVAPSNARLTVVQLS